jgi:hypothetical protein
VKMPFGKYENRELTRIPKTYLRWLRTQNWLGGWLAAGVDEALGIARPKPSNEPWQPSEGEPWGAGARRVSTPIQTLATRLIRKSNLLFSGNTYWISPERLLLSG